jgi:predicted ATPase
VGRTRELAALEDAYRRARDGRLVTVHVAGRSGMGKSALLDELATRLEGDAASAPLVLRSRCYEREAVPFNALDGAMDALALALAELAPAERRALVPSGADALTRLFPVLEQSLAAAPVAPSRTADPERVRAGAVTALAALLRSLAAARPLVLLIDDAHWADADSATLLAEVLEQLGVAPPALLLVAASRSDAGPSLIPADTTLDRSPAAWAPRRTPRR